MGKGIYDRFLDNSSKDKLVAADVASTGVKDEHPKAVVPTGTDTVPDLKIVIVINGIMDEPSTIVVED